MCKICVTGHRPDKLYGYDLSDIRYLFLKQRIKKYLIEQNCTEGITGMALGVDMIFALAVIDLKDEGYDIKLHCAIPCLGHTSKWFDKKSIELYNYILSRADMVKIVSEKPYDRYVMQTRNMYMVDNADMVLAVWNGSNGGTKNCIDYAKNKNKEITYFNPYDIFGESA